jgi:hypothetical protein
VNPLRITNAGQPVTNLRDDTHVAADRPDLGGGALDGLSYLEIVRVEPDSNCDSSSS